MAHKSHAQYVKKYDAKKVVITITFNPENTIDAALLSCIPRENKGDATAYIKGLIKANCPSSKLSQLSPDER